MSRVFVRRPSGNFVEARCRSYLAFGNTARSLDEPQVTLAL
ncbi:hypothetical protein [Rhizobium ruizarguesonis]|nr:hypothetical protein [Rhizobium ruizarguesonis]